MRIKFPIPGINLYKLMISRGIDNPRQLSSLMHEAGIFEYYESEETGYSSIDGKRKTINNHISGEDMTASFLKAYCDFFGCSADYILGYIDMPTHDVTDINKATGLSEAAINYIEGLSPDLLQVLNFLLENEDFKLALQHLGDYKLNCIRTHYAANKDDLLKSRSPDERREKYVEDETILDSLYAREYFINQSFEQAALEWIRQKQHEVSDLSPDKMQKIIDEHIQ